MTDKDFLIAKWQKQIDVLLEQSRNAKNNEEFRDCISAAFVIERRIRAMKGDNGQS